MARNVEIKARVEDMAALCQRAAEVSDRPPRRDRQEDVFLACPDRRMKLRILSDREGELISYDRPDQQAAKACEYYIYRTKEPQQLLEVLTDAYGQTGRVCKQRTLYMVGRTRIHLDTVETLGNFMELEVVMAEGEPVEVGVAEAEALMVKLGLASARRIEGAYFDLLEEES